MPHVVTERCQGCRYTDCVEVCPCDCFYRLDENQMLVINPVACIDCFACQPACPVGAIYLDDDVPDVYQSFIELNADRWSEGANITKALAPLREMKLDDVKARERDKGYGDVMDPC